MQHLSNIIYVGADDDNLDLFEGQYPVPQGISYNSYLIEDQQVAIIDAVDRRRTADWLSNIATAVRTIGRSPQLIIIQHAEPDHTGSLGALLALYPDIRIICTAKAAAMLADMFTPDIAARITTVTDGQTISLGHTTLRFITAPMVHWPEVMLTLDITDGVLFSADAFGTFAPWASTAPWDDEARRYYTNIVGRFGPSVQTLLKKLAPLHFNTIAPLHGPLLHAPLHHYINLYDKWSRYQPETPGVLIAYASIYGGTAEAARRIAAILRQQGAHDIVLFDLCRRHVSYAVAQAFRLSSMILACATYDSDILPAMQQFLHHIQAKRLTNRAVGLIENGAWAPTAARRMSDILLRTPGITILPPTVTLRTRLHSADIATLTTLAHNLLTLRT